VVFNQVPEYTKKSEFYFKILNFQDSPCRMSAGTWYGGLVKYYEAGSTCQQAVLLNKLCSFAVLLHSVDHGKKISHCFVKNILHNQCCKIEQFTAEWRNFHHEVQCLLFFMAESWFTLKGNVNSQSKRYRCSKASTQFMYSPLCGLEIGECCAMSICWFKGPLFLKQQQIIHRLWTHRSPDLNLCNFCLWEALKNRVYVSIPHSLLQLKG
jgi:hypothetical protein